MNERAQHCLLNEIVGEAAITGETAGKALETGKVLDDIIRKSCNGHFLPPAQTTTAVEEIFVGNLGFYASNLEFCATFPRFHRNIPYRKTIAYFSILPPHLICLVSNNAPTDHGDTVTARFGIPLDQI
jgi:hypothetical protein